MDGHGCRTSGTHGLMLAIKVKRSPGMGTALQVRMPGVDHRESGPGTLDGSGRREGHCGGSAAG